MKSSFKYTSFEMLVLSVKIYSVNDKSRLATVYRPPPGHHKDIIKRIC